MPRKPPAGPQSTDTAPPRASSEGPSAAATWTQEAFAVLADELRHVVEATERKVAETWDEGKRSGYDLGYAAGARDTEAELRAFYEEALTEQEAAAGRALQEQSDVLEAVKQDDLARLRAEHRQALERLSQEQEARLRDVEARLRTVVRQEVEGELRQELDRDWQRRLSGELQAVEERVRSDTERAMRAALATERDPAGPPPEDEQLRKARAEGYTQGLNESARRYEEAITRAAFEHREAIEAAYRKGYEEAGIQTDKELKAAYQEGYRLGLQEAGQEFAAAAAGAVPAPLLDEARRQAYEMGYEDGRGVGLARGRRQTESELSAKLQEATRVAYREGFLDGKRAVADAERSWAFGVLHLPPDATASEVKQHYKRLSMALHPDQNPQLSDTFIKNLNRAKQLLDHGG